MDISLITSNKVAIKQYAEKIFGKDRFYFYPNPPDADVEDTVFESIVSIEWEKKPHDAQLEIDINDLKGTFVVLNLEDSKDEPVEYTEGLDMSLPEEWLKIKEKIDKLNLWR